MRYIFMDNYRGFSGALIPLRSANFLVGENSTGKSSFLSLISLLSSPTFWVNQDFGARHASTLGGFKDIVSAGSSDQRSFTVGVLLTRAKGKGRRGKRDCRFMLMTFGDEDGVPRLRRYTQFFEGDLYTILFQSGTTTYKALRTGPPAGDEQSICDWFRKLYRRPPGATRRFKNVPGEAIFRSPLPVAMVLVESQLEAGAKRARSGRLPAGMSSSPFAFMMELAWLAPIRSRPRRTYDGFKTDFTPQGDHTPYVIRRSLSSRGKAENFARRLRDFGSSSGLFETVKAHPFGRDPSAPFEVMVRLAHQPLNMSNVGYGVSQVLPVVVEMLTRPKGHWFAIQQPEVHLHPRAQAALGDLMHFLVAERQHHYLVETHSDYLIDRFRLRMKERGTPCSAQVIFFERSGAGNRAHILPISEKGRYPDDQPHAFRDFFINEEMRLLDI